MHENITRLLFRTHDTTSLGAVRTHTWAREVEGEREGRGECQTYQRPTAQNGPVPPSSKATTGHSLTRSPLPMTPPPPTEVRGGLSCFSPPPRQRQAGASRGRGATPREGREGRSWAGAGRGVARCWCSALEPKWLTYPKQPRATANFLHLP